MIKCLKITFSLVGDEITLHSFLQKYAKQFNIEGVVQRMPDKTMKLIACGEGEAVDEFVDFLHKGTTNVLLEDIELEPFLKDKDYRGVFRVIE